MNIIFSISYFSKIPFMRQFVVGIVVFLNMLDVYMLDNLFKQYFFMFQKHKSVRKRFEL